MSTYSIGIFDFIKWEGPPPQLVKQHLAKFTKTGQAGISAQLLGIHGDSFDVQLFAAFPTQDAGMVYETGYRTLIGDSPQIILFNDVNYFTAYGHTFLVESVETTSFKRHPLLISPSYAYYGGWLLKSRWLLTPIV